MSVPFLDLRAQGNSIRQEVDAGISRVLDSANFVLGPEVSAFELEFAAAHESSFAVACSSGTAALHLILRSLDVGPGDEIITVSTTFAATVAAILYTGATPVLIDIDPDTWNMAVPELEAAIGPQTKAIMPVHFHGRLADRAAILEVANRHGVPVIEDAAQAHLANLNGIFPSHNSYAAAFSFYPGKNLGAYGEGGCVLTNSEKTAIRMRRLRDWGADEKYNHFELGFNYRMDALQAAILSVKLKYLHDWTEARRQLALYYTERLAELGTVSLPAPAEGESHVFHVYSIGVESPVGVALRMQERGVSTGRHYPIPVHKQHAYEERVRIVGDLRHSLGFAATCLSLPIYPEMTSAQVDEVVDAVEYATQNSSK